MLLSELLRQLDIPVSEVDGVAGNGEQTNLAEAWTPRAIRSSDTRLWVAARAGRINISLQKS
jgi:hypothetical protein